MGCEITKNLKNLPCKNTTSGFRNVYFIPFDADDTYSTVSDDTSGHTLTAISGASVAYVYKLKNNGNVFNQTITSDDQAGTTSYEQTFAFVINKVNRFTEYQIKMMAWGQNVVVAETNSGIFLALGVTNGCNIAGTSTVAGEIAGFQGYNMTATAQEPEGVFYLTSGAITQLKALVPTGSGTTLEV